MAASSETRIFVMKQNAVYVLVLGIETGIIVPVWIVQLSLLNSKGQGSVSFSFYTPASVALAVILAVVLSLRGAVDLLVWWLTFSITCSDFRLLWGRIRGKFFKNPTVACRDIDIPLLTTDTIINKALRRDAMYCINIGILDAVHLDVDKGISQEDMEERISHPCYREQTERKIKFPQSATINAFSFVDIEPTTFHLLRCAYQVCPLSYRKSFKLQNAADVESSRMMEKFSEGKSGSFFYFSHDCRYIIKTVTPEEEKFLHKIAHKYYHHMKESPNSLIVRFYGLHKVRLAPEQRYISVIVMENIFSKYEQLRIDHSYDLKGSSIGRRALKGGQNRHTFKGTLKDLDLNHPIIIGPENKSRLMKQLQHDVSFLTQCGIMDYSFLLGIHNHSKEEDCQYLFELEPNTPWFRRDMGGLRSYTPFHPSNVSEQEENERYAFTDITDYQGIRLADLPVATYFFGIVDILQEYNLRKKAEQVLKTKFLCQNKHKLSVVDQEEYGRRFLEAMGRIFQ